MKVVAILQARMHSSRLPGKMLLPLCGAPLVQRVVERVQRATRVHEVVVAFPVLDTPSFRFLHTTGVSLFPFVGDENDLVERYLRAALAYEADLVVRIPCDNPCVMPEYIDKCIEKYLAWPSVFESNAGLADTGVRIIDGIGCEVFSVSRLKWLDEATKGMPKYREHPHLLFHDYQEKTAKWSECRDVLRLDVNSQADYDVIRDLYDALWPSNNNFTITDILAYMDRTAVRAVMMYDGPIRVEPAP